MARRFHFWFLLPAMTLLCVVATGQALLPPSQLQAAKVENAAPITLGQSVVSLYGPWKFQTGDSPIDPANHTPLWSEPGFDDSAWETIDLKPRRGTVDPLSGDPRFAPGWTAKGHPGYWGWAWYRIRISITPEPSEQPALATFGRVDDAYQLFDNGVLVGNWGEFRDGDKRPVTYFTQPVMFRLPKQDSEHENGSKLTANPETQVLSFRIWMGTARLSHHPFAGGLLYAPLIGNETEIAAHTRLEWLELIRNDSFRSFEGSAYLLLAIVALSLILFDRTDPVYMWVAGALFMVVVHDISFVMSNFTRWESFKAFFILYHAVVLPTVLGVWAMVWWMWFQLRRPAWAPKAIAVMTVLYSVSGTLGEEILDGAIPQSLAEPLRLLSFAVRLLIFCLLIYIVGKGIQEQGREGWLVLPAVISLVLSQFQQELIKVWHGTFSVFGVIFYLSNLAYTVLVAVTALLLMRRLLLSIRRQRQIAIDVKQAQELQQLILPDAMTTLPGLSIQSEYRPALEVGGDFFQVLPHKSDGSLLIVAGDVAGKGLKAGMLVALVVGAIRTAAQFDPDPLTVLQVLNLRLCRRGQANATCLALSIARDGSVKMANAGHIAPYLNGEQLAVEGALPLGIIEGAEFSVMHFHLKDDDKLVLMSDGIAEATDADGALFGFERVHELLRNATTAAEVASAAQRFGQEDDISVISITRTSVLEPVTA